MNTQKKVIIFTDRQLEMIELLKGKTGFKSLAEVMRGALSSYFDSNFPAYKVSAIVGDSKTAEKRAEFKVLTKKKEKEIQEEAKIAEKRLICERDLFGEVADGDYGKVCRFKMYYADGREAQQQIPLTQAHPIIAENSLFVPSREIVLKKRPELIKKLGINE